MEVTKTISRASTPKNETINDKLVRHYTPQSFDDHANYFLPERARSLSQNLDIDLERGESDEKHLDEDSDVAKEEAHRRLDEDAEEKLERDPKPDASEHVPPPLRPGEPKDSFLVTWNGPDDPENPKNWTLGRKWAACVVVSAFTFISPVSSSMVAPALPAIGKDLGIDTEFLLSMVLSIFVLAYAVGPLFLGPLSEIYGRTIILQLTNLVYLLFNLVCGFSKNKVQLLVFRFLSGFGGSAPLAIGGAVLGDCFRPEQRGLAIGIYSLMPLLGPAIGPIAGGYISQRTTWRWIFWSTTIFDAVIQVVGLLFLQETYAPVLLQRKAAKLRKSTGNEGYYTEFDTPDRNMRSILGTAMSRPFILLGTQPIIQFIAFYMA
jgi:multidrug resistance protein